MQKNSRILISGAGIAGLVSAYWLAKNGMRPIVVEKAESIRADGFIISLSHESYRFAESMGIMPKLRQLDTLIRESAYYDRTGTPMLELKYNELFSGVNVVQVMRDDLQMVLYELTKDMAEFRFNSTINSLTQGHKQVSVEFNNNQVEEFDAVIGADGLHSNTRNIAYNEDEVSKHYMGLFSSAYRLKNTIELKSIFENHMERNRYMCVYTTRENTLACVYIWKNSDLIAPPSHTRPQVLKDAYRNAPELVHRILEQCPTTSPLYMDPLIQINLASWSKGRVVLLGDAAHCLTLLSGQGASSAFWGASILARNMIDNSFEDACGVYENELKPILSVVKKQTLSAAKWYVPQSNFKFHLRDAAMKYLPNRFFQHYFKLKYSRA